MSPPADPLHWAGCVHGQPATWDVKALLTAPDRCGDCVSSTVFLAAVLRGIRLAAADLLISFSDRLAKLAQAFSRAAHAWAVETREAARKPPPPEQPCRATLNTGGFELICAWREHGEPEHCDPAYGVWTAHGSGAPR